MAVEPTASDAENPPSPPPAAEWNIVARHWRGLLPLWVSYWVINLVVGVSSALIVASIIAVFRFDDGYEPTLNFVMFVAIWAAVAAISVWQIVGLWRSANRHIALRATIGKRSFWARAAQFAAILMAINGAALFVREGVPQLSTAARIAFMGDPEIAPYTIRTMRNGTEVEITGGFKYGLTKEFGTILAASPQLKVVHLHSGGGRIGEAKKLHAVFKKSGLITYVSLECASACALAFAGGKERFIAPRGKLGFHAPSFPGVKIADMTDAIADQSALFIAAGFSPAFVSRALNTPSSTLWKPTTEELVRANAITGIADNARFAVSGYGADNSKEAVEAFLVRTVPLMSATKEKFPARYTAILDGFYQSYVDGDTERQQFGKMRQSLLSMLEELRPMADDAVLVDFARMQLDSYKHLFIRNPTSCYLYSSGTSKGRDFSEELGADLLRRERELNARIVNTAAPRPEVPAADLKRILFLMFQSPGATALTADERALLRADAVVHARHGDYCLATIKFYTQMLALPEPDAANALRVILKGTK